MDRAIIYARVSTDEQANNTSLQSQLDLCKDYCKRKKYVVVKEVREDFTGTKSTRPALSEVIDKPGLFDVLVVMGIDRFARTLAVQVVLEKEFKDMGKRIEYVIGGGEDTPEGRMAQQMQAIVSEYEVQNFLRRTQRGKAARAKAGKLLPGPFALYGYDYVDGTYKINEDEAKTVRLIYDLYLNEGMGIRKIAHRLSELRIPTRKDGRWGKKRQRGFWAHSTVFKMLTNESYLGTWTFGGASPVDVKIDAIIDKETFKAVRRQMKLNRVHAKRNTRHDYLLRQRLVCGKCGRRFAAETYGAIAYYRCAGQRKTELLDYKTKICHRSLRSDEVDGRVWRAVEDLISDPARIRMALASQKNIKAGSDMTLDLSAILEKKIGELEGRRERLVSLYEDAHIPKDVLDARMQAATSELDAAREQLADLRPKKDRPAYTADEVVEKIAGVLPVKNFAARLEIMNILDAKVVAFRGEDSGGDQFRITIDFGDEQINQLI